MLYSFNFLADTVSLRRAVLPVAAFQNAGAHNSGRVGDPLPSREITLPAPFNLREWPLFRVARNIHILDEDEDVAQPDHRARPPLGMSLLDRQAEAQARERDIAVANDVALQQRSDDVDFWADLDQQNNLEAQQRTERDLADEQRHLDELNELQFYQELDQRFGR